MKNSISSENFHAFREWRKSMILYSTGFCPLSNPSEVTSETWTSDEIVNMFDVGFRWACELIKSDIEGVLRWDEQDRARVISNLAARIDERVNLTFYNQEMPRNHTDNKKSAERLKVFHRIRDTPVNFPKMEA